MSKNQTAIPRVAPFAVASGAATDVGRRRAHNEDSFLCAAPLFLVADGMGGYSAGEVASAAVIEAFAALVGASVVDIDQMRAAYTDAVGRVAGIPPGSGVGPGTTLSGVGVSSTGGLAYWLIINVGDSRTYRFSNGELEQISVDHSVVQEMVELGDLTAHEAARDSRRNVVTRAIGAGGASEPDFWLLPAAAGDRILVCSDGLSGELSDGQIAHILASEPDPTRAARRLVAEACEAGGRDNVTVVVVDAEGIERHGIDADTAPRVNQEHRVGA